MHACILSVKNYLLVFYYRSDTVLDAGYSEMNKGDEASVALLSIPSSSRDQP